VIVIKTYDCLTTWKPNVLRVTSTQTWKITFIWKFSFYEHLSSPHWSMSQQIFYPQVQILHKCIVSSLWEEPINWTWLWLSVSDWSIIMIGPGGLLLVVPTYMQLQLQFYWWGCQRKKAKLRHLILLSRVT
jgi:hypothetical protein